MSINFHTEKNRYTYASRPVDSGWADAISGLVEPEEKTVLDIGCGGGIYAHAWVRLGAKQVIGIDFSEKMIQTALEHSNGIGNLSFHVGNAAATQLNSESADIVFERAIIHHIFDLSACLKEAYRLLRLNGIYLIQDRTLDDVKYPSSKKHIRGFLFEKFPRLLEVENMRRRGIDEMERLLLQTGFINVKALTFWETRRRYTSFAELANDLRKRSGRSILHELTDKELQDLIAYISIRFSEDDEIVEQDRWTIWYAQKAT